MITTYSSSSRSLCLVAALCALSSHNVNTIPNPITIMADHKVLTVLGALSLSGGWHVSSVANHETKKVYDLLRSMCLQIGTSSPLQLFEPMYQQGAKSISEEQLEQFAREIIEKEGPEVLIALCTKRLVLPEEPSKVLEGLIAWPLLVTRSLRAAGRGLLIDAQIIRERAQALSKFLDEHRHYLEGYAINALMRLQFGDGLALLDNPDTTNEDIAAHVETVVAHLKNEGGANLGPLAQLPPYCVYALLMENMGKGMLLLLGGIYLIYTAA